MSIYSEVNAFLTPANWGKKMAYNPENNTSCILGASSYILYGNYDQTYIETKFTQKIAGIVEEQFPERFYDDGDIVSTVTHFNDHKDTTLDDIRLVLEKADADS